MKYFTILTLALLLATATVQAQVVTTPPPAPSESLPAPSVPPPAPSEVAPDPAQAEAPVPSGALGCRVVTGRVTDMFAYPLTGATVILRSHEKGFSNDAFSTNAEGQFIITSKQPIPQNTVLEITAAGYTSLELPLANCQELDLTLVPLPGTRFKADGRIKKTTAAGKIH
ncbi:hypothetical protein ACVWYF_004070 [Hymenobacter sp. UYAg731]